MSSSLQEIQSILGDSIELIDENPNLRKPDAPRELQDENLPLEVANASSLLDQCNIICDEYETNAKPLLRVIHHFACSGGTLISKCIAAMPGVVILSEVHPHSGIYPPAGTPPYMPTDVAALAEYADVPDPELLAKSIFKGSIDATYRHIYLRGGTLVLRDHTHSDFCLGSEISPTPGIVSALEQQFNILSLITLRDPIDSYLSLKKRGWVHFEPDTFEEYCRRLIQFLDSYPSVPIVMYEDFVSSPARSMLMICELLQIPYDDLFEDIFPVFRLTGNSGRSGDRIQARPREALNPDYQKEIEQSNTYKILNERFRFS